MDEEDKLNDTWKHFFGAEISDFERRLIATFVKSLGVDDPIFMIVMMLVRTLFEEVGATERAILRYSPELSRRMIELGSLVEGLDQSLRELNRSQLLLRQSSDTLFELQRRQVLALKSQVIPAIEPQASNSFARLSRSFSNAAVAGAIGAVAALLTTGMTTTGQPAAPSSASWDATPTLPNWQSGNYTNGRK